MTSLLLLRCSSSSLTQPSCGPTSADGVVGDGPDQFIKKGDMDLDMGNPRDEMLYTAIHTMTTVTQARFLVIQRAHLNMILRRNT